MNIDTLAIARDLRAAELSAIQAEATAAAIGQSFTETAATKADVREIKLEIETKIESVQAKLIMWFVGAQLAFVALLGAMIKF